MEFDLSKKHCFYFNEISKIPHGSRNESRIADYIVEFAKEHNLAYKRDDVDNVIIFKEASKSKENDEALILQAHIDMVCEKNNDVEFDFEKDSLNLYVEDGYLKAKGTTLGADDGTGVSYMLAILDDDSLVHPKLECIFTTMEEIGLLGAANLKKEDIIASRMINLDGGGEVNTCISSSGGRRCVVSISTTYEANSLNCYRLAISGLKGGHSGGLISKNRGNSNVLASKILNGLKDLDLHLISFNGGLKENAIPREAVIEFSSSFSLDDLNLALEPLKCGILEMLNESDNGFEVKLEPIAMIDKAMTIESTNNVINFIYLSPNGFIAPSMAIEGLTLASLNMGVVRTFEDKVNCYFAIRSPLIGYKDDIYNKIALLASICNGTIKKDADYPGWPYKENSKLRELLTSILKEKGIELKCQAIHGGLECGHFVAMNPDMDIITYGPKSFNAHTPDEMLDLASFDRSFEVLKQIIRKC